MPTEGWRVENGMGLRGGVREIAGIGRSRHFYWDFPRFTLRAPRTVPVGGFLDQAQRAHSRPSAQRPAGAVP